MLIVSSVKLLTKCVSDTQITLRNTPAIIILEVYKVVLVILYIYMKTFDKSISEM